MTVRLRPHHLLCMLTFIGKGYSEAFTANYRSIARRLSAGENILIVEGPDDICAPLLGDSGAHCRFESVVERDRLAALAVEKLLGQTVDPGMSIHPDAALLDTMRTVFAEGALRTGCGGCEWSPLCTDIAASGFKGALVGPVC